MKKVYLMRHAKSDWSGYYVSDFERDLNKRGEKDAPLMGKVLKDRGINPSLIISSPAKRAKLTAKSVAKEFGYDTKKILFKEEIYEASVQELLDVINSIYDKNDEVLIVGHNPSMTEIINILNSVTLDNLPTAAVVGFSFDVQSFKDVKPKSGKFLFFEYPKKYKN